ncbi:MAG: hypothetical protein M3Q58_04725 [Bacteroidota bacterium]|nr:hypothetical protein [Bacteroidota bacterium]
MEKITTVRDLKREIEYLELRQAKEWPLLKIEFQNAFERLKPLNYIKNTLREFTASPDFNEDMLGATMGITAGYLSKTLIVGDSHNPLKKILGTLFQLGVSNVVSKNSETIKLAAGSIFNFFSKIKNRNI